MVKFLFFYVLLDKLFARSHFFKQNTLCVPSTLLFASLFGQKIILIIKFYFFNLGWLINPSMVLNILYLLLAEFRCFSVLVIMLLIDSLILRSNASSERRSALESLSKLMSSTVLSFNFY